MSKEEQTETDGNNVNGTNTTNAVDTNTANSTTSKSDIKIEVLNGSGSSSNLQKAVDLLEEAGYDVTKTGPTSTITKTMIYNKKEISESSMEDIQKTLGTGTIQDSKSSTSKVQVQIVLGKDFN